MEMTKQEVINKVEDLEHDNKALWHIIRCLEEDVVRINKKLEELKND